LKEEAVGIISKELRSGEGVPTDSESMKDLFHRHGVNMRYLGELYKRLESEPSDEQEKKLRGDNRHLKTIVEREIVLRSAKHVFNEILKEQSGESCIHLAHTTSHLLNCILAPTPFFHHFNSQSMRYEDDTLQASFSEFPETV
jgi:hypothetical protein